MRELNEWSRLFLAKGLLGNVLPNGIEEYGFELSPVFFN